MVKIVGKLTKKGGRFSWGGKAALICLVTRMGNNGMGDGACGSVGVWAWAWGTRGKGGWAGREAARVKGARPRKQGAVGQIKSRAN